MSQLYPQHPQLLELLLVPMVYVEKLTMGQRVILLEPLVAVVLSMGKSRPV